MKTALLRKHTLQETMEQMRITNDFTLIDNLFRYAFVRATVRARDYLIETTETDIATVPNAHSARSATVRSRNMTLADDHLAETI
jgi:hypothetical protein